MSHIKTFGRIKPAPELYDEYEIKRKKVFSLKVPEVLRDYGCLTAKNRSQYISYDFQFEQIFDTNATQEEVYNVAAKEIVAGFLDGYNGTIFAYGQTGTGKTYTMEGGALRYSDRGMAPRALAEVYKSLAQLDNEDISLQISYLEIYQEVAYDLLSTTARTASPVVVFPRVNVMEGNNGTCMIRNLSVHHAPSEDVAHALLLQGQANRKVAETPVNQRSSRSHAVFTIYLSAKKQGSDMIRRSKLHLVDLAGSERVAKTGVDGQQLTEAKSINLSLHHLETVIIALQADSAQNRPRSTYSGNKSNNSFLLADGVRRHVPYRNSLLTMVLRDSLGGNCLTSMVATFSLEVQNLGETLSTCRFAQRVSCISNHARRNEEIDDKTLIQQLKRRVAELEAQMACLRMSQGGNEENDNGEEEMMNSKLTDEDKLTCAQVIQEYLAGRIADPVTAGITNPFRFRECLRILKRMVMNKYFQDKLPGNNHHLPASSGSLNYPSSALTNNRGVGVHGDTQILRLDNTSSSGENQNNTLTGPGENGTAVDTDELIFNIQRLYAASRRDQKSRLQGMPPEKPTTPPRTAADTYKSPFERKREKEIRKLSRRVDSMRKSQTSQEQQLQMLRTSTAFGELTSTESIIRNKIQVTREQIADQHAYRLHLRHTEAHPDILRQEKLVEDQLVKREAKFQKKLDEVLQKKAEMEAEVMQSEGTEAKDSTEGQGQLKGGEKRSLEEQFAQFKKRNGTLNTRQVFDMLKSEEKKQSKATQNAETEKKYLMTKQLAQKEEATRERLRELKEMLRKSREAAIVDHFPMSGQPNYVPVLAFSAGFENGGGFLTHGAEGEKNLELNDLEGQDLNETFLVEKGKEVKSRAGQDDLETSLTRGDDREKNQIENGLGKTETVSSEGNAMHSRQQQNLPMNILPRNGSCVEMKWDSAYSRPSTAHSLRSQELPESRHPTNMTGAHSGNNINNTLTVKQTDSAEQKHNGRVSKNSISSSNTLSDVKSVSPIPLLSLTEKNGDCGEVVVDLEECDVHDRGDSSVGKNTEAEPRENYSPTVMPSEYVHGMNSRDKFDARKMGLSSKTFDSALSSMLHDDSKPVTYGSKFYDQYARAAKPPVQKYSSLVSERRTSSSIQRSLERRPTTTTDKTVDHTGKFVSAWGPEAKNFSVAKRLAQFLSDESVKMPQQPRPETTTPNKMLKSVSFLERLTQLQTEEKPEEMTVTSPRIQALQDPQRETTYMGRIQAERERVAKIRQAREAAEAIQRAWRQHCRSSK